MKKAILLLLLLWALTVPAWGTELPREVRDALPAAAEDITEHMDDSASFSEGLSLLWERACGYLTDALRESISGGVLLLAAAVLCALTEECMDAAGGKVHFVPMAGALAVTLAAAGSVRTMMGLGQETVEELNTFSKALLPTLSAAVAASGGILSASVRQVATVFFVDLLLSLIRGLLLPLVYFYVAAAAADAMLPGRHLAGISTAIRKGTVWLLTGALALFTLYLTVSGAAAGSADTVTARLARGAVGVLPVVGSILADAADTVLAGAGAVRNTVGVAGLLAVLAVCLLPLVRLGTQYLVYKAAAFLAGVLGAERLTGLIDALGGAFGLIFGMTGACGLLLLISILVGVGGGHGMMDGIRQWLLGVLAAAMALSLLYALLPKGAVRGAARATGGLILLLVVLGPLAGLELSDLALRYEDLSRDMERQAEAYRQEGQAQLELGIQQRTAAYISEKAAQLGLSCRPRVETAWRDGVPYPSGVTLDIAENQALAEVLTDELGIPPSQQHWLG